MNVVDGAKVRKLLTRACDVVVVGSGPAGAAVARTVATGGLDVVVVEEGPLIEPGKYAPDAFGAMADAYREMGASVTRGRAPMPYLQGRAVGGGSVINGAISWRLPRDVHDEWCAADPALADALPWPALDSVHDEVEARLHIRPTSPSVQGANDVLLARGAEALGLAHRPIRRNVAGCEGLGRCLQGCPKGRKTSMDRTYLRDACENGAEILSGITARKILIEGGRATGVMGTAEGGATVRVSARHAVVVAASAIQSPLLLWRSGIRNGPVGEGFQCHPGVSMAGYFDTPVRIWTGSTQGHEVIGLRREGLKFEALGFDVAIAATRLKSAGRAYAREIAKLDHWAGWGAAVRAEARGRVRPGWGGGASVAYTLTPADMKKIRRGLSVLGRMMLAAGARYVTPGVAGFDDRVTDPRRLSALEEEGPRDPRAYAMVTTHLFGTCRMGSDPERSVVRPDFRHHALGGLYVADSSVFPSSTGVNPQTSIIALATVCGRRVLER
jgi:choline dehydrogenase-like flavoprotein